MSLLLLFGSLQAEFSKDQCPAILDTPEETKRLGEMRLRAIKGWDKLITWALSPKNQPYHLSKPLVQNVYLVTDKDLFNFVENYGYFSIYHPIVGIVTPSERDIHVTQCLLNALPTEITNVEQLNFSINEILAKIIAYRPLKKGMKLSLNQEEYQVDEVIDLWRGMPAFCLIPEKKESAPPILLFRGTDLDLVSEKGWASILSDLDTTGPGHTTFLRAQKEIHAWLNKMIQNGTPAIVTGFSLGGVFVLYTLIYEHALINQVIPSVAFNPPGISKEMLKKWEEIPEKQRPPHRIYVNQGDVISQIGFFPSNVWEITLKQPMEVIQAHVTLICAQPLYKISAVDVALENKSRE